MNPNTQIPQTPMMPLQQQSVQQQSTPASGKNKSSQLPQQPFTAAHHHIYNTLRNTMMQLVQQGVPGIDKVLAALNNSHVDGIKSQAQQAPQMPQQMPQGVMGGGTVGQAAPPPMMPGGGM